MPRVWGAWPFVQTVFQNMLEKPNLDTTSTSLGLASNSPLPPAAKCAVSEGPNRSVTNTSRGTAKSTSAGYTHTSQSFSMAVASIPATRRRRQGTGIPLQRQAQRA